MITNKFLAMHRSTMMVAGIVLLHLRPLLVCRDGFTMSVQASHTHYCSPRNDYGPYTHVEIDCPSTKHRSLSPYSDGGHDCSDEIRRLPTSGGAAVLVCYLHFLTEITWRRDRIREGVPYDLPLWDNLKVVEREVVVHHLPGFDNQDRQTIFHVYLRDTGDVVEGKHRVEYLVNALTTGIPMRQLDGDSLFPGAARYPTGLQTACDLIDLLGLGMAEEDEEYG